MCVCACVCVCVCACVCLTLLKQSIWFSLCWISRTSSSAGSSWTHTVIDELMKTDQNNYDQSITASLLCQLVTCEWFLVSFLCDRKLNQYFSTLSDQTPDQSIQRMISRFINGENNCWKHPNINYGSINVQQWTLSTCSVFWVWVLSSDWSLSKLCKVTWTALSSELSFLAWRRRTNHSSFSYWMLCWLHVSSTSCPVKSINCVSRSESESESEFL